METLKVLDRPAEDNQQIKSSEEKKEVDLRNELKIVLGL